MAFSCCKYLVDRPIDILLIFLTGQSPNNNKTLKSMANIQQFWSKNCLEKKKERRIVQCARDTQCYFFSFFLSFFDFNKHHRRMETYERNKTYEQRFSFADCWLCVSFVGTSCVIQFFVTRFCSLFIFTCILVFRFGYCFNSISFHHYIRFIQFL